MVIYSTNIIFCFRANKLLMTMAKLIGDNNDVAELEKLQVEMGWLGRIRAGDINVG